nr:sigma-70 family RNA polymerase sigma factor [uncultured Brumimicrobium sp.]
METEAIYSTLNEELYFFILKKVKRKSSANDIFQNTFLKIHDNLPSLKNKDKAKSWVFQIARNEIINYIKKESVYAEQKGLIPEELLSKHQEVCCFDRFINELPKIYKETIELVYIEGKKQKEVATTLNISLENVKARIRRAKLILAKRFNACCKYKYNEKGQLVGEANCSACEG